MPFAIYNGIGMTLRIDEAGRIVVPKPIRDRLGLTPGSSLEIRESADGFALTLPEQRPAMIKKKGLWVHTGKLSPGYDLTKALAQDREERARKLTGI